jgi:hypothetical protein
MEQTEIAVRRGIRSSIWAVVINLILSITKCIAGIVGHSFALVADGIESLSDVVSSSVVTLGLWLAIKPPDEDHPYGHGKAEPIAAVVVSLTLIAAGIAIAVESIVEIRTPHRLPAPYTLAVLIGVVATKVVLSRYVGKIGTDIESTAVKADAWHHLSDASPQGWLSSGSQSVWRPKMQRPTTGQRSAPLPSFSSMDSGNCGSQSRNCLIQRLSRILKAAYEALQKRCRELQVRKNVSSARWDSNITWTFTLLSMAGCP